MLSFAMFNIYKTIDAGEACITMRAFFYACIKILRYIVPPCGTVIEPQHQWYVLNSGKGNIPFFIYCYVQQYHQSKSDE